MRQYISILIFFALNKATLSAELPADIKKCHFGDEPCLIESTNYAIRKYYKGIPEINVPPLEEIKVDDITLLNSAGPLSIYYKLKEQVLRGFENATLLTMKGFDRDPKSKKMELKLRIPRLFQKGNYELQGHGLILHTNTTGTSKSDLQNVTLTVILKTFIEYHNGKRYLKIYDLVPLIQMDRWILWVDDLYKENTDLTIVLNRVINDNWLEFWNEIEPILLPVYAKAFSELLDGFAAAVPYDDLFLPD